MLPYRALCEQKVAHFRRVLGGRWDVRELYGQHGLDRLDAATGVVVCTIEKAHALVQRLLEDDALQCLGCVVVDELHMVRAPVCNNRKDDPLAVWEGFPLLFKVMEGAARSGEVMGRSAQPINQIK